MKKEDLINLVNRPEMISGIYNYCDRWCERCSFTSRCANYAISEQNQSEQKSDPENKAFWDELHNVFQLTLEMVKDSAEEFGIDLDAVDLGNYEEDRKKLEELTMAHNCVRWSKDYITYVNDWFDSAKDLIEEKGEEWESKALLGMPESNIIKETNNLNDIIDVLRWYQYQIHVKLRRAIHGKLEEVDEPDDEFPKDSDGSAKVALIGIDRSIAAWGKMLSFFPDNEDETFKNLVLLEKLRKITEKEIPNARSFHRAGFDDK
ncbi:MAG: hypothetical protein KAR17_18175 [Cyclobacteriaceae bacterium]|nr:hypothetical protein [Cyclobacteriaceae bacterium]